MQANFVSKKSRCSSTSCLFLFAALAIFAASIPTAHAQFTFANDNAGNTPYLDGWATGDNGGSGFGSWTITTTNAAAGVFTGNPTNNGMNNIGIGTPAFGLFSTWANDGYVNATRSLSTAMGAGDTFSFYWDLNWDTGNASGSKGFDIRSGSTSIFTVLQRNTADISIGGITPTIFNSSSYGTNAMLITITKTTTGFTLGMSTRTNSSVVYTTNVTTSSDITGFNLFTGNQTDNNGNRNEYFNNFLSTNSGVFTQGGSVTNANTFSGTGNLSLGNNTTLALSGSGNNNYTGATTLSNGSTLRFQGTGTSDFASAISGGGTLVVSNGAGQVNLQANNSSFTGDVTVANGSLEAQSANALGPGSGTTTVQSGGTLRLWNASGLTYGAEALTINGAGVGSGGALRNITNNNVWQGNITLGSGARINSDNGTLTISGTVAGAANSMYFGGAGNVILSNTVSGTASSGDGAIFKDGTGVLTLQGNNTNLSGLIRIREGTISIGNANSLGSGVLELGGMANAATLLVNSNTTRTAAMQFSNNSTNSIINVASGSTFTATGSLTQDGTPANTTKFGKDGAGTLILAGASGNNYNGQIQIGNGTVVAGTSTALGTNASTVNRGIDLGLNISDASQANSVALRASNGVTVGQSLYVAPNTSGALRTIGLAGSGTNTFSNEIYLDGTVTVDTGSNASDQVTISGAINNTGGLTKTGAGVLLLSGNNGYTGPTTINAGTLRLGADNRISSQSAISISNGATLDLNNFSDTLGDLSGAGNINLGSGNLTTLTASTSTFSGAISGSGTVTMSGTGQLNFSGANSYTGLTTISSGSLEAQSASALGSTNGATTVSSGANLKLFGGGTGISYNAESITLNGFGPAYGDVGGDAGALRSVGGGTNTWNGAITLGSSTRINSDAAGGAGSLTIAGAISGGTNVLFVGTKSSAVANMTISGALSGAGAAQDGTTTSLFKDGASTLILSGNNSYSGDTRISAGNLTVASGGNLGDGTSDVFIAKDASLTVNANAAVASLREWGTTNGGTATIGSGATLTVSGDAWNSFMNSIGGAGNLTKSGTGTMNLYGTQGYTGTTTVSGGKLSSGVTLASSNLVISGGTFEATAANIITNTAAVNMSSGTFALQGSDEVASFTMSGGTLSTTNSSTLTAANYNLNGGTVSANLGSGSLLTTNGSTTLSGTSGATSVGISGGLLSLGAAGRLASTAAVSVSGNGELALGGNEAVASVSTAGTSKITGTGLLTAATYALNGGTVSANLGTGTITSSNGSTTLNGTSAAATVNVSGGLLALGAADRLANSAAVNVSSGTLDTATFNDTVGSLTTTGGTVSGSGTITAANYNLNGGTINANLGTGTLTASNGTTALNGIAAATTVTVSGGTLNTSGANKLADSATVAVTSGTLGVGGNDTVGSVAISSSGTVSVATNSTLTATANSTISGTGKATGGTLAVANNANLNLSNDAKTTTSDLSIGSGSKLAGTGGTTGKISGGGLLSPGNSPGILTAGQVDVSNGMDFAFEFTGAGAPTYSLAGNSRNDLLHLTNGSSPFVGSFSTANNLSFYFNDSSLLGNLAAINPTTYLGGFYVDSLNFDIAALLSAATKSYYVFDANGTDASLNGQNYRLLSQDVTSRVIFGNINQSNSNFDTGTTNGTVLSVTMVPEPSSASLLTFALSGLLALRRRRRA